MGGAPEVPIKNPESEHPMKFWQIVGDGGIDALELAERPSPEPGPG